MSISNVQSSQMPPSRPLGQPLIQPLGQPLIHRLSPDSIADAAAVVSQAVAVHCEDRWQVYHRLQELEIDCRCHSFQPLQVHITTPTAAVQLWSIVKSISDPRTVQIDRLTQSWLEPCAKR